MQLHQGVTTVLSHRPSRCGLLCSSPLFVPFVLALLAPRRSVMLPHPEAAEGAAVLGDNYEPCHTALPCPTPQPVLLGSERRVATYSVLRQRYACATAEDTRADHLTNTRVRVLHCLLTDVGWSRLGRRFRLASLAFQSHARAGGLRNQ